MWTFILWLALLAAAGLCYPRRPRTAGALFIGLGLLASLLGFASNGGRALASLGAGLFWLGLGTSFLVRYRTPDSREKHVHYWTAKT